MADVFLSYARADQPLAVQLAGRLDEAGFSVWWDRHIQGGADFSAEIEREIKAARLVVVVWSKSAIVSPWVRDEAGFARDERKLVPVRADDTLPPFGFRQLQVLDFSQWSGQADDACFVALLQSLQRMLRGASEQDSADLGEPQGAPGGAASRSTTPVTATAPGGLASLRRPSLLIAALLLVALVAGAVAFGIIERAPGDADVVRDEVEIRPFSAVPGEPERTVRANSFTDTFRNRLTQMGVRNVTGGPGIQARSEFVLLGEVARDGDREIFAARLDDRTTGATLWSVRREPSAGAAWEANLAGYAISCALKRRDPERGPELLSRFLLGCASFLDRDMQAFYAASKAAYREAPDDPHAIAFFAVATAGSAYLQAISRAEYQRMMDEARGLADQALRIDPQNADAAFAKGLSFSDPQFAQQEHWWRISIEADPDTGMAYGRYGNFLAMVGRTREAMDMQLRAAHDRPNLLNTIAARLFAANGDWRQAEELFEMVRAYDPATVARRELATYVMYGDVDTATRMLAKHADTDDSSQQCWKLLLDARRGLGRDAARFAEACGGGYDSPSLFAIAGDIDGAFEQIDQFRRDNELMEPVKLFGPEMRELRRDPRFWPLVARIGLTRYWLDTDQWPDFCRVEHVDCRRAAVAAEAALEAEDSMAHPTVS